MHLCRLFYLSELFARQHSRLKWPQSFKSLSLTWGWKVKLIRTSERNGIAWGESKWISDQVIWWARVIWGPLLPQKLWMTHMLLKTSKCETEIVKTVLKITKSSVAHSWFQGIWRPICWNLRLGFLILELVSFYPSPFESVRLFNMPRSRFMYDLKTEALKSEVS